MPDGNKLITLPAHTDIMRLVAIMVIVFALVAWDCPMTAETASRPLRGGPATSSANLGSPRHRIGLAQHPRWRPPLPGLALRDLPGDRHALMAADSLPVLLSLKPGMAMPGFPSRAVKLWFLIDVGDGPSAEV